MSALSGGTGGMGGGMGGTNGGSAMATNGTSLGGSGGGGTGGGSTPSNSVAALAKQMAAKRGWTGQLWTDLNYVEMREAGWNLKAKNPSSDAYGIAQFINGPSEYFAYGGNPNTAQGQVTAFENYVQQRYHGPAGAAAHERAFNWYGQGTRNARRGAAIVGDQGPEVMWMNGGENISPLGKASGGSGGGMGGCTINLQFGNGSVQISGLGAGSDVSSSAKVFAQNVGKALAEKVIQMIAAGAS
jgi:hypothetical protein